MGVVRTDKWLQLYWKYWRQKESDIEKYQWQQQTLIHPLIEHFQLKDVHSLHHYLLEIGLFHPDLDIESTLEQFHKKKWWHIVHSWFKHLQKKWAGPDVPIYLFPVEPRNEMISSKLGRKMGLTLPPVSYTHLTLPTICSV